MKEVLRAIKQSHQPQPLNGDTDDPINTTLDSDLKASNHHQFHESLRSWICFADIDTRHEKIATAYEQTFEWIYCTPNECRWFDFSLWLADEHDDLYWITGKAASGKSTLIKFIYGDARTTKHLTTWANGRKLVKCAFYFWNSGTPIQMSEEGMIRTLLHSALREAPELWSILFPSKMEEFILFSDLWSQPITEDEAREALQNLINGAGQDYRLFVFIDGLDECGGSCEELIAIIRKFSSSHVKVCVSSRTWIEIKGLLHLSPKIRLEALTYGDIERYVTTRFLQSVGFWERQLEIPREVNSLIEAIMLKASGVFLWVTLVTDYLIDGLKDGEKLAQLQERLNVIPEDLEALFQKILTSTKEEDRRST
ncbi:NACHT domain containing protein [Pyrenophora tritici-repentis]|nr:NACHT domain containing protein [Pyrenophora tritici-repentis]